MRSSQGKEKEGFFFVLYLDEWNGGEIGQFEKRANRVQEHAIDQLIQCGDETAELLIREEKVIAMKRTRSEKEGK
jgi:hypothetical protein